VPTVLTSDAITEERVLTFEDGIPGFEASHRFVLVEVAEGSVFQLLQSLDEPDVALVVTVPWLFFPDYAPELSELERRSLGIERPEDAIVFCAVTLDAEHETIHLNLLAPFVVHAGTRRGRQVILVDSGYPVRAPVRMVAI
jgi:flagellar assembly factor FliW